jgi:hypothetical protein
MVENAVAFFYPNDPSSFALAPQLLGGLLTRSRQVILTNMKQLVSLTLGILKSLYPRADLDMTGTGFVASYIDEEASKFMEDSAVMVDRIIEMLLIDMS